ncbi:MAG: hypothetical protein Q9171_002219 [Xanthocarpia ochracea]
MANKRKRSALAGATGNVSAFAARQQATKAPQNETSNETSVASDVLIDAPTAKKRKRGPDTAIIAPIVPQWQKKKKKQYKGNRHTRLQTKAQAVQQPPASQVEPDAVNAAVKGEGSRPNNDEHIEVDANLQQLSTFRPSKDNIVGQSEEEVTIRLDDNTLTLIGQYQIWVRKGAVSVFGAALYAGATVYRIYAPSTHSLPVIRPIRDPFGPPNQPVEITLSSIQSGIRLLKHVSPIFDRIWNKAIMVSDDRTPSIDRHKRTFSCLKTSADDGYSPQRSLSPLELPNDWQPLLTALVSKNQLDSPITVLVAGPKSSGKSTFSRMLVNGILARKRWKPTRCVALLDVDPGQPEFSPPGEISLVQVMSCTFGPPFCHPIPSTHGLTLVRAHHIGATSPSDDPEHYLRCVSDLFQHYHQLLAQHPSCPLIVNTAGWIQGKGLEILSEFIHQLNPTDVIYTSTLGPSEVVDSIAQATAEESTQFHSITSRPVEAAPRAAADLRLMQTLSYFHLDEAESGHLRWNATPIDEMVTLQLHYAGPKQEIYCVQLLGPELDPEFLIQVLEGCVVGLVVVEEDAALPLTSESPEVDEAVTEENDFSLMDLDTDPDMIHTPRPNLNSSLFRNFRSQDTASPSTPVGQEVPPPPTPYFTAPNRPLLSRPTQPPRTPPPLTFDYTLLPQLPRSPEQIPYMPSTGHVTPPLSPANSYSLGQGLIRSVDTKSHTFHLITPVPHSALDSIHTRQKKLVLVRGSLETPTWSYKEDLYKQMRQRKKAVKAGLAEEVLDVWDQEDTKMWAEGRDWISAEGRSKGERAKRVRRDLGKKTTKP